jgi:MFS family permease
MNAPGPASSRLQPSGPPAPDDPVSLRDFLRLFTAVLLPMFLAAVDQTLLATATPVIAAELGGLRDTTWIAVGYLLAMTIILPTYGRLGDRHGRRELLLVALGVFALGSIACALAQSMLQLILARVLQGLGGGGLMVMAHALIGELVPPRQRPRFQAYFASVFTLASVGGPVLGGLVVSQFSWRWLFAANLPLVAFAAWRVSKLPAGARHPNNGGVSDVGGMILFAIAASTGLVWLTFGGDRMPWLSIESLALLGFGALTTGWLIRRERRVREPFLPIEIFRIPGVVEMSTTVACFAACMFAIVFFLPIYLQLGHGTTAQHSGLLLLPLTLGLVVGATMTGRIVVRTHRPAAMPPLGLAIASCALAALAATPPYPWLISVLGLACGVGLGGVMPCAQVIIQSLAGRERLGAGAATLGLARVIGASLGTAGFGAIAFALLQGADLDAIVQGNEAERGELIAAFHVGFIAIAVLALAGAIHARRLPDVRL